MSETELRTSQTRDALASDPELDPPLDLEQLDADAPSEGLDRVSGFLRDEPEPEVDWRASEARLLAALGESSKVRRGLWAVGSPGDASGAGLVAGARRRGVALAATLALAAGALGLYATQKSRTDAPTTGAPHALTTTGGATAAPSARTLSGDTLPKLASGAFDARAALAGERVTAGDAPITLGIDGAAGRVRFTLAPRSRVRVEASAGADARGHVLSLEEGAVHAEVSPELAGLEGAKADGHDGVFAVRVDGVTVSVRGTAFTVTRVGGGFEVDVSRGTVAVAASSEAARTLLRAPARASYSESGARETALPRDGTPTWVAAIETEVGGPKVGAATNLPAPLATLAPPGADAPAEPARPSREVPEAPRGARPPPASTGTPKGAEPSPSAAPSAAAPRPQSEASVRAGLRRCFDDHRSTAPDAARVTVSSTLRLTLRADGTVSSARFDPPLAPAVMTCAQGVLFGGAFAPGTPSLSIALSF